MKNLEVLHPSGPDSFSAYETIVAEFFVDFFGEVLYLLPHSANLLILMSLNLRRAVLMDKKKHQVWPPLAYELSGTPLC